MPTPHEAEARLLALALPEAYEDLHRGKPTFRVNKRIFMMLPAAAAPPKRADGSMFAALDGGGPVALVKLTRDDQLNLIAAHPGVIREAGDYAHHGWTHVALAAVDGETLALVIRLAWLCVAPKRLSRSL